MSNPFATLGGVTLRSNKPSFKYGPVSFWCCLLAILAFGSGSLAWCQTNAAQDYGEFCGIGHFPIAWAAGFLVYPAYVLCLISVGFKGGGGVLCFYPVLFHLLYYLGTLWFAFRERMKYPVSVFVAPYLISLALNFFNFMLVGVLSL